MASASALALPLQGFFHDLKEIEDAYHAELEQLKRKQRDALRRIETETERKEVEKMKARVTKHLHAS